MKRRCNRIYDIPIKFLCFDYRDSILFWSFVISCNEERNLHRFSLSHSNEKIKNRCNLIHNKLITMKKSIKEKGQTTPIPVIWFNGKLYPVDGTKRLAVLLALGKERVKIQFTVWMSDFSIKSSYFKNMDLKFKNRFKIFRKEMYESGRIIKEDISPSTILRELHLLSKLPKNRLKRTKTR